MNSNIGHKTMSVLLADLIIKTIYFNVSWTFIDRFIYSSKNRGYLMYSKSRGKKKDLVYSRERFKNNEFLMPCFLKELYNSIYFPVCYSYSPRKDINFLCSIQPKFI